MKLQKFKSKQILKLFLLKSRGYENNITNKKINEKVLTHTNLTKTLTNLKKALQIIFKYHRSEKKILFIGLPKKLQFKINTLTKHVAVPESFDLQFFFSNNNLNSLKSDKNLKLTLNEFEVQDLFLKLKRKPDLLVFVTENKNAIYESYKHKLPMIFFGYSKDLKNVWTINSYRVSDIKNNLSEILNQDLFFASFNFLFKVFKNNKVRKFSYYNKNKRGL